MRTLATSEAGLVELAGDDPRWIWAFTCPTPGCACRTALVLSTDGDRQALAARGAPVRDAWLRGESYAKAAAALEGVTAFAVDIDEGGAFPAYADDPHAALDFDAHPEARQVVDRIDGETLEELGRLWYRGKGWPDPEEKSRQAAEIQVESWKPGEVVAWGEALVGVRQDIFRFGERVFEAVDLYCVAPGCSCGEVVVDFAPVVPRGAPAPGAVRVAKTGTATLEPEHERHRERLEQLWAAFCLRHPRYVERLARRSTVMQGLAGRIVGAPRADRAPNGEGRAQRSMPVRVRQEVQEMLRRRREPMAKTKKLDPKLQAWADARQRHHLSHAHVQMARELGLNPTKLGGKDNHRQEPWKLPLPEFIEHLYEKRFGKTRPDVVTTIEERARAVAVKEAERKARKLARRSMVSTDATAVAVPDGADES